MNSPITSPSSCQFWIKKNCDLWYCGLPKGHQEDHVIAIPRFNIENTSVTDGISKVDES